MAVLYNPVKHSRLIPSLAKIHKDCIERDGTISTFLPPLSDEKMISWWATQLDQVPESRFVVMTLDEGENQATAVVMCSMPRSDTGPFRGLVENLHVSPDHRRKSSIVAFVSGTD